MKEMKEQCRVFAAQANLVMCVSCSGETNTAVIISRCQKRDGTPNLAVKENRFLPLFYDRVTLNCSTKKKTTAPLKRRRRKCVALPTTFNGLIILQLMGL